MNLMLEPPEPEPADKVSLWRSDDDLPGTWSHSDFEGGDPDERSYAEREGHWQTIGWIDEAHHWPMRFITGIAPADDIDFDAFFRSSAIWTIPQTMQVGMIADDDMLDILFGGIPLCHRRIPTKGTE